MISNLTSRKENEYEGFRIIDEALENKMTKDELIRALKVMWLLVMEADKETRDEQYLFGKGLLSFNEVLKDSGGDKVKLMKQEQRDKLQNKVHNIKPLVDFLLKMKDVINN